MSRISCSFIFTMKEPYFLEILTERRRVAAVHDLHTDLLCDNYLRLNTLQILPLILLLYIELYGAYLYFYFIYLYSSKVMNYLGQTCLLSKESKVHYSVAALTRFILWFCHVLSHFCLSSNCLRVT